MENTEKEIELLSEFSHCRIRTEIYLGSRSRQEFVTPIYDERRKTFVHEKRSWVPSVLTAYREAWENSIDELIQCGGGSMAITYDENESSFSVVDQGRGIPLDWDEKHQAHKVTLAVSQTRAGRNFYERDGTIGMNGIGISVVNMCSDWFKVVVRRDGQLFQQKFIPNQTNDALVNDQYKISPDESGGKSGTKVSFKLSSDVFPDLMVPDDVVRSILTLISIKNPSLKIKYNGKWLPKSTNANQALFPLDAKVYAAKFQDVEYVFSVTHTPFQFSMVNNIPTFNGGPQLNFVKPFAKSLVIELARESKRRGLPINEADVENAMALFAFARVKEPSFDSPAKTMLTNSDVFKPSLFKGVSALAILDVKLKDVKDGKIPLIERIYECCKSRSINIGSKDAEKNRKELKKMRITTLTDCSSRDRDLCSLAIFEGESASQSYKTVRNPKTQALIPLRGKIKNVWSDTPSAAMSSQTIKQLCAAMGLVPGKRVDKNALRYGQVQCYTDADDDGANIMSQLIALFYRFWPELFDPEWLRQHNDDKAFFKIAQTPLIILTKGKERKYFYTGDSFDMNDEKRDGWKFSVRAKGLAALDKQAWKDHVNDEKSKIPVIDTLHGELKELMDVLFNSTRADDRKEILG